MTRSVPEWIGKTDDARVPDRVQMRTLHRFNFHCAKCTRLLVPGEVIECDHIIAIINGGENRESNLQPLCENCHTKKTARDVSEKSKTYNMSRAAFGLKKTKGRPMDGARASRWKKPFNGPPVLRAGRERRQ